jgi:hypothetical protein
MADRTRRPFDLLLFGKTLKEDARIAVNLCIAPRLPAT